MMSRRCLKTGAESYNQLVKDYNDKLAAYQADANALRCDKTNNDALSAYQTDKLALGLQKTVDDYNNLQKFNEGENSL